jgi:transcriptional regulator with XRE-family HTH domain
VSGSRLATPTWDTLPRPQVGSVRGAGLTPGVAALNTPAGHAALISGDIGRIIQVVRKGLQLGQADVARIANAAQASISRIENGRRNDPALLSAICTGLGILSPARAEQDPAYSEDMRRRDLLKNIAAAASAAMLPVVVTDAAHAARIGSADIDECWAALRRLQNLEDRQGGGTVYQLTAGIASHLQDAVGSASYGHATGCRLREVTAVAAVRAGWQAFDSSRRESARRWWLEASHLADLGEGADQARVMALAAMAIPAREAGRGQEAIGLARAAQKAASPGAHPKLLSLLAAREAIGHAGTGDTAESARCLVRSRQWLDRDNAADAPAWLSFWGQADLATHEMHCARAAKNTRAAERAAREAVAASSPEAGLRNHTIYSAYLGNVLACSGKLDESISVTQYVLGSGTIAGSQRVASEVRKTAAVLALQSYRPATQLAATVERLVPAA